MHPVDERRVPPCHFEAERAAGPRSIFLEYISHLASSVLFPDVVILVALFLLRFHAPRFFVCALLSTVFTIKYLTTFFAPCGFLYSFY